MSAEALTPESVTLCSFPEELTETLSKPVAIVNQQLV